MVINYLVLVALHSGKEQVFVSSYLISTIITGYRADFSIFRIMRFSVKPLQKDEFQLDYYDKKSFLNSYSAHFFIRKLCWDSQING